MTVDNYQINQITDDMENNWRELHLHVLFNRR